MKQYYLLDLERTESSPLLIWWKPNNHGYTTNLDEAGKYNEDTIINNPIQYNDKDTKIIPCEEVDKISERVIQKSAMIGHFMKKHKI